MTAQQFFDSISITDANNMVIDKKKTMYHPWDLVRFAEDYHLAEKKRIEKEMIEEFNKWLEENHSSFRVPDRVLNDYLK